MTPHTLFHNITVAIEAVLLDMLIGLIMIVLGFIFIWVVFKISTLKEKHEQGHQQRNLQGGKFVQYENSEISDDDKLIEVVRKSKLDIAKFLVEKGADVNAKNNDGRTPLMCARDLDTAKFLVEKGADVNAKENDGWTALMYVAVEGYSDIVKFLVEKGADVNAKNRRGRTALIYAKSMGHLNIVEFLRAHGAKE